MKIITLLLSLLIYSSVVAGDYLPGIAVLNEVQKENSSLDKIRVTEYNLAKRRTHSITELLRTRVSFINDRNSTCYYRELAAIDVICVNVKLKVRIEQLRAMK